MSSLMHWAIRIGIVAAISALSVCITLFVVAVRPKPSVPLTEHLSGQWSAVSQEFDRRVKSNFPIGSSEAKMAEELQREGFSRDDWQYLNSEGNEAKAMRREDGIPCAQAAYVYWRANSNGKLTSIRGIYQEEGCL